MEDCKKLESMARDAQEKLQQCRNNRRSLVEEIRSLEKRIRQLTTNVCFLIPLLVVKYHDLILVFKTSLLPTDFKT